MIGLQRRIYCVVVGLHPASFRDEFGREMVLDFEDALARRGFLPLLGDAVLSVARQWTSLALNGPETAPEMQQPISGHPFLSGRYLMVDRGHLTLLDWFSASVLFLVLMTLIGFAASVPNRHVIASPQTVRVAHDGGLGSGSNNPSHSSPSSGLRERSGAVIPLETSGYGTTPAHGRVVVGSGRVTFGWRQRASGGPPARALTLVDALCQLALISGIIWVISFYMRRIQSIGARAALTVVGLFALTAAVAFGAPPNPPIRPQLLHATDPPPSFEVATVKPRDPKAPIVIPPPGSQSTVRWAATARTLVAIAYNIPISTRQRVAGGPDWMDAQDAAYVIEGKVPDDFYARMQTMTGEQRREQACLMLQSLLADRFKLKVHFETHEMPVYELTVAKGGPKLPPPNEDKPTAATPGSGDPPRPPQMGGGEMVTKDGLRIHNMTLDGMLTAPWFGLSDRPIVNETGLTGTYNLTLSWLPDIVSRSSTQGPSLAPEGQPSIFTVLHEQLGLKLVSTKAPVEVVVIDRIERPSEN